jgi:hypothetical protein
MLAAGMLVGCAIGIAVASRMVTMTVFLDYGSGKVRQRLEFGSAVLWDEELAETFGKYPMPDVGKGEQRWRSAVVYRLPERTSPFFAAGEALAATRVLGDLFPHVCRTTAAQTKGEFLRVLNHQGPREAGRFARSTTERLLDEVEQLKAGTSCTALHQRPGLE